MPRLTFALVVHGEQAYLDECTSSLLGQDFSDVELVVVDDASQDHAPELLDELAERDSRVRVRHLEERVGLGAARNLALEMAEGDYVWFVHTTDLVRPGALTAVARRLRAGEPDVLLVHHVRTDPLARSRPGPHKRLLSSIADRGSVTLDEEPGLADAAPRAWNKVLRRALLEELGVRFGEHGHGELTVTWPSLLAAERIAAAPAAAYVRRRPANAVRDRFVEGTPFDLFAAHDAVHAWLADPGRHAAVAAIDAAPDAALARPAADASPPLIAGGTAARARIREVRRRLVLPAMLRQQLSLMPATRDRREFFGRMSEGYRRYRTGAEPSPVGRVAGARQRIVERGDYRAFQLLEQALRQRRAVKRRRATASRVRGRLTAKARQTAMQRHYRRKLEEPIDPNLAVFAAYWYRGYNCNPRAIYEKARELVPGMRGVWVVKRDAVKSLPPGVEHVVPGTREYYDVLARATYFVNNVNFPNYLVKREGTTHVMTHHGTPLKRMGLDLREHPVTGRRMDFPALLRRCERWDYSISSNTFSTLIWERVYPTRYETLEVGYPRNDVLANATEDDARRVRSQLGIEDGQTAVLYAPTHREYQVGYTPFLDLAAVVEALGPDHVVLARLHYLYGADPLLRKLHRAGRLRDVAAHPSVEELCLAADALVTDYSSLMFDFAVLDRPIVVHAPDWEAYRTLRGTYFDLLAEPPGTITRTEPELVAALRDRTAWSDHARQARAAFRARFCALDDGRAAERVVRRVWLGEREPATPPVPVAG